MADIKSICVFCGASTGNDPLFAEQATHLGRLIGTAGIRLVFGGGRIGLMGAVADGALAVGGEVIGVIPDYLKDLEHGHPHVTDLQVVDSMHSRKQRMFELADGFVTLPGGVGTLDETFEIVTWKQLRMHDKPIVIVDTGGYWKSFDTLVANAVEAGFASPRTRTLYKVVQNVEDVLTTLSTMPAEPIEADSSRF
ncbi:MAG: TIGR00730 family Rossman fold protein [Rhodospirillaceae bacterium]|nr:TIGR00730 family Rossman fold protein [Rhodospirillaceae bacterium]